MNPESNTEAEKTSPAKEKQATSNATTEKQTVSAESEKTQKMEKSSEEKPDNKTDKSSKPKPLSEKERLRKEVENLKKRLKEKEKEIQEQKSKYRYLQAEMENTRKHFLKQQDVVRLKTRVDTITAFTPLIEAFEKAFETATKQKENGNTSVECQIDNFMDGFKKLYDMLKSIFKNFQVEPIDKTGVPFDFNFHEVMMKMINDDLPEDTVINIIQKGYKIKDQVIQPAKVIVSKHSPPPPPPPKSEEPKKEEPTGKKESEEKTTEEKPTEEILTEEKPTEEKPTEEQPTEEKSNQKEN